MSSIYLHLPPTRGKVLIETTYGEISMELFSKESPKACLNFVQLCQEGYFNGSLFYGVYPNKYVETGNPMINYGCTHGISSFDSTIDLEKKVKKVMNGEKYECENEHKSGFPVENHSRLRFIMRGLVAMSSKDFGVGKSPKNFSSFFISLGKCEEFNHKHTIFGRILDNTIFNVMRMSNLELKESPYFKEDLKSFPVYPPKIVSTEVLENPFTTSLNGRRMKIFQLLNPKEEPKKKKKAKKSGMLSFAKKKVKNKKKKKKVSYSSLYEKKKVVSSKNEVRRKEIEFMEKKKSIEEKKMGSIKDKVREQIFQGAGKRKELSVPLEETLETQESSLEEMEKELELLSSLENSMDDNSEKIEVEKDSLRDVSETKPQIVKRIVPEDIPLIESVNDLGKKVKFNPRKRRRFVDEEVEKSLESKKKRRKKEYSMGKSFLDKQREKYQKKKNKVVLKGSQSRKDEKENKKGFDLSNFLPKSLRTHAFVVEEDEEESYDPYVTVDAKEESLS